MKKIVATFCACLVSASVMAASYSSVVGPVPSLVVPFPSVQVNAATAWTTNVTTNVAGTVKMMYTNLYVCPVGGVSTGVTPPYVLGDLTDGASVVWRKTLGNTRKAIVISNVGTNPVYISEASNAVGGCTVYGAASLPVFDCANFQKGLWMRCASTTTVSVLEM